MRISVNVPASAATLQALLEGLVQVNLVLLMTRSELPEIYDAGVRYRREPGTEIWQTCEQVFKNRGGDCEDLCAWRVAELRLSGEDPGATCIVVRGSKRRPLWHVLVRRGDGSREDPSRVLGMGSARG